MSGTDTAEPARTAAALLERRANRMDLVSRWADDLAHEIKNPLHAMVINLELVKRRAASGDAEPAVQRAEVVENELHRVHGLVESLLRLVRPWAPEALCDPDRVFEHLLPVLRARSRIRRVDFEHTPGGGAAAIAPGDLAQVLLNLVDNAIEASPEEGRVSTTCSLADGHIVIKVRDEGPGLPARVGESPEYRDPAPREGRGGLGLPVSVAILRQAGGSLTFQPGTAGRGTVAVVRLPRPTSA